MAEVTRWLPRIVVSACRKLVPGQPLLVQQPAGRGGRALGQQGDDEVLDRDVLVLEPRRLLLGGVEQAGQPLGDDDLPGFAPGPLTLGRLASSASSAFRSRSGSAPGLAEQPRNDALGLIEQGEQQMLTVDLGVAEAERLGLRVVQCFLRLLGQVARVHVYLPGRRAPRRAASSTAIRSSRSVTSPMAA